MRIFCLKRKHSTTKDPSTEKHGVATNPNTTEQAHSQQEERKLRRLQRDGIIILIDQPNLEIGMRKRMRKVYGSSWALSYGYLVDIIARRGHMSSERRRVLGTYIVTSKQYQVERRHRPSRQYLERNKITLIRSPDERTNNKNEKGVDATLVRIMTQEFEGIDVLRLKGMTPPKRTFCLVAGDFDYVDVVRQARECGCDVEIWFWRSRHLGMSGQWYNQYAECSSERCGEFSIKNLTRFREDLTRSWQHNFEAWSESD